MAQAIPAILFARVTAASLRGRRCSSFSSYSVADLLPGLVASLITAAAPVTSSWRNRSWPGAADPAHALLAAG
jgi:hypothetical protein